MNFDSQEAYWDKVAPKKNFTTTLDINLIPDSINKDSLIVIPVPWI